MVLPAAAEEHARDSRGTFSYSVSMEVSAVVLPWACAVIFVFTVVVLIIRARNDSRMRDLGFALYLHPRLNLVLWFVKVLIALGLVVLGVAFLQAGFTFGWGFFPLAGSQALIVALYAWSALKYRRRTIRDAMRSVE